MAEKPTIPDFPTLPDFGHMITQACEVVASVRGIPYDFSGTLSLENKFVVLFKTVKEMFTAQDSLVKSYKELYDFINSYFSNLNVQEEVNNKIQSMSDDGSLLTLIKPTLANDTGKWLLENITNPSNPPIDKSLTVTNAAADAKVTGDNINKVTMNLNKSAFNNNMLKIFYTSVDEKYNDLNILPTNSIVTYTLSPYPKNMPIQLPSIVMTYNYSTNKTNVGGTAQILTNSSNQIWFRIAWGDPAVWKEWSRIDNNYEAFNSKLLKLFSTNITAPYDNADTLPTNSIITYTGNDYPSNIPVQYPCTIMTYSYLTSKQNFGGTTQILTNRNNQMWFRMCWDSNSTWREWVRLDKQYNKNYITTACYKTFGVIGDSYSSGETYYDGSFHDNYYQSWGQILARKHGNTCINFSKGGLTTRTWLTDSNGLTKLENNDACDLYFCALGINDAIKLGETYLGSLNDMNIDYTTNPDTFYGNYGKIIGSIKRKNANATIILTNIVLTGTQYEPFSNAIKEIADHSNVMFIDTHSGFFTSSEFKNTMVNGHPTNQTYTGMANMYDELFGKNYEKYHDYLFTQYKGYVN